MPRLERRADEYFPGRVSCVRCLRLAPLVGLAFCVVTNEGRCAAVLYPGGEQVRCDLRGGHDGMHSGRAGRSYLDWPSDTNADAAIPVGSSRPTPGREQASYADMRQRLARRFGGGVGVGVWEEACDPDLSSVEVNGCVVCRDRDLTFVFTPRVHAGRRVAIPRRVGLCARCLSLLHEGHYDEVAGVRLASGEWRFRRDDLDLLVRDLAEDAHAALT